MLSCSGLSRLGAALPKERPVGLHPTLQPPKSKRPNGVGSLQSLLPRRPLHPSRIGPLPQPGVRTQRRGTAALTRELVRAGPGTCLSGPTAIWHRAAGFRGVSLFLDPGGESGTDAGCAPTSSSRPAAPTKTSRSCPARGLSHRLPHGPRSVHRTLRHQAPRGRPDGLPPPRFRPSWTGSSPGSSVAVVCPGLPGVP